MRRQVLAALLMAALPVAGLAQQPATEQMGPSQQTPPAIRYGKWGAALLFASLTALGVIEHDNANQQYAELQNFCRTGSCGIGTDGRYTNPLAEARYQEVVQSDRTARAWLISGQVALAGTAALFVVELLKQRGTTNVPFRGLVVEPRASATRLGWRISF